MCSLHIEYHDTSDHHDFMCILTKCKWLDVMLNRHEERSVLFFGRGGGGGERGVLVLHCILVLLITAPQLSTSVSFVYSLYYREIEKTSPIVLHLAKRY